ncbi:MAG TPA: nitrous oxide reductase accessory protein NosL [bacterium]|nr:nitrous oxide reductase accessory protein NosL [bacterium]
MRRGAVIAVAALVAACSRGPSDGPPTVHFGQDVCAACTMIVSEQRFASAIVPDDGRRDPLVFDDLGCLFSWEESNPDVPIRARWVHDHDGPDWVRAESAWYVRSPEIRSPMGSGVAAFASEEGARELHAERGGELREWAGLQESAADETLVIPPGSAGLQGAPDPD